MLAVFFVAALFAGEDLAAAFLGADFAAVTEPAATDSSLTRVDSADVSSGVDDVRRERPRPRRPEEGFDAPGSAGSPADAATEAPRYVNSAMRRDASIDNSSKT